MINRVDVLFFYLLLIIFVKYVHSALLERD